MEYGDQKYSLTTAAAATQSSNKRKAGRKKFKETRHPVYKGVRQRNGKWVSELRKPNKKSRVWVGTFSSPYLAARAYDVAALALKGESASLNFPNDVNALPRARSSSIRDIQEAAMEAAERIGDADFSGAENVEGSCGRELYFDEEEVFNMPRILDDMAEGLILTPLGMRKGFSWDDFGEDGSMDLTLWKL